MKFIQHDHNYTLKIERGELLVETLTKFIAENNIKSGWVLGLGGLAWVELGFYDLDAKNYEWTKIEEVLELTNLTGNIAWSKGKPALHLHATVSDKNLATKAGHLKEAEVGGTVEISIHSWLDGKGFKRSIDENTGLNLLDL